MARRRILAGGIAQESHSFNPIPTTRGRFTIQAGAAAVNANRKANSTLGGIIDAADEMGAEVIVPTLFRAQSGGLVDDKVFDEVAEIMIDAARKGNFDAIVLPLHGGMLTPALSDPEGRLMQMLRDVVGLGVPITTAFDLHAHVTAETLAPCDFLAAYLTNPHGDQAATSRRAFKAAIDILEGRLDPVCGLVHFPMLTLGHDRTDEEPLMGLHALAKSLVDGGDAYDVSIFNAQQFIDVPNLGQTILVYTNGDADKAASLSEMVAGKLWKARDQVWGKYPSLEECLERARQEPQVFVLGDQGDRVAGGGPGDSTFILNAMLESRFALPSVVPVYAPEAVEACKKAGAGSQIELRFGGRYSTVSPPVTASGVVVSTGENTPVVYDGPADTGTTIRIESHAVFKIGEIRVLLTSQPYAYIDPQYFRAVGVEPEKMKVVVTRSGYHFSLNFAPVGECITIDTPGMTSYYVDQLPWQHARPFYPVDKIGYEPQRSLIRRSRT